MKKLFVNIFVITLTLLYIACSSGNDDDLVAEVFGEKLYNSDLEGVVPAGLSKEDSLAIIDNYVQQWIQEMVVLEKAKKNIDDNFEKELQNYKNSLLTYHYESSIIEQLLDTVVSESEIENYYNKNKAMFVLKNNIIRAMYVKVPKISPATHGLKKLFTGEMTDKKIVDIEKLVSDIGIEEYRLDPNTWMTFMDFQKTIPINVYNEELYLQGGDKDITFDDKEFVYIAKIFDSKIVDETSPLDFEYQNIKAIILNKRKVDIIENMRADLLEKAKKGGDIKIYYKQESKIQK